MSVSVPDTPARSLRAAPAPPSVSAPATSCRRELVGLIPDLRRAARAIVRDPDLAEDLVQEALLRVWTRLREGGVVDDLRPYLMTTLRNLARRPPRLAPAEAAAPETTEPAAAGRIAVREVAAALAAMPPDQARLLLAAASGAGTLAQIAAEAGLPPGTVASRVWRARARLRAAFDLPEDAPVAALLAP
ncbi:MAG: sigma-70 family RNA polymerase sigma factor [Rhodobacteraceae bacterium]|jgi:RNA polymerase sigma-70 factor (ECF subfamily)|nr:sigma-70 family RNA polymerase sigma factor [Paracoccaceae bacterium]